VVDQYLLVVIFAVVAILIPASMLVFSRLVRPRSDNNDVETLPYESAEESFGGKVEIMHEYLHYFVAFLAFEIISIVIIIWSTFPKQVLLSNGTYMIALLVFGFIFEILLMAISKSKGE